MGGTTALNRRERMSSQTQAEGLALSRSKYSRKHTSGSAGSNAWGNSKEMREFVDGQHQSDYFSFSMIKQARFLPGIHFFFLKIKKMFMIHHEGLLHIQWLKVWEKEIQPCNSHMIRVLITFWSSFFVFGHHFLKRLFHKIWGKISFVKQFYCWFISVYFKTKIRNPSKVIMMNIKEIVKNEI